MKICNNFYIRPILHFSMAYIYIDLGEDRDKVSYADMAVLVLWEEKSEIVEWQMIGDNLQWWPMAMLAMMITWQWWQRFFQPKSGELLLVEESRCFFLHHRHSQTALVLPKNPEYIDLKVKIMKAIVTMKINIFIIDQLPF